MTVGIRRDREAQLRLADVLGRLAFVRDTLDMMLAGQVDTDPEHIDMLKSILGGAADWERQARRP